MSDVIVDATSDHVAVSLNRPPVNALTMAMFEAIHDAFDPTDGRAVLLASTSGKFCAGFDVQQFSTGQVTSESADVAARACLDRMAAYPGPIVAAVEGAAVGFGLLLAMSADLLVIHPATRVGMPEVKLGVVGESGPLRRYLSSSWVRRICLLGDLSTAMSLGLGDRGALVSEQVADVASGLIAGLCDRDAAVVAATKSQWVKSTC